MDHQQNNVTELSDIFEPDMYNGHLHHLPSINVMLASHLGAAGSDNVSEAPAYAFSKRRNSDSSVSSSAEASHADIDDFEIVDYDIVYAQSQEELVQRNNRSGGFSPSFTPTGTPLKLAKAAIWFLCSGTMCDGMGWLSVFDYTGDGSTLEVLSYGSVDEGGHFGVSVVDGITRITFEDQFLQLGNDDTMDVVVLPDVPSKIKRIHTNYAGGGDITLSQWGPQN